MSKQQLPTNTPINESGDEDYLYEQYIANEKLNEQYWEAKAEETMDRINAYYDTRFCTADVEAAVAEVTKDERIIAEVTHKLNEIYLRRQVMNIQLNS
jgi:hypothetical protein